MHKVYKAAGILPAVLFLNSYFSKKNSRINWIINKKLGINKLDNCFKSGILIEEKKIFSTIKNYYKNCL